MSHALKPYPAYKDTGVSWLGKIPIHWRLLRTKHLFSERVEKGFPNEALLAATQTKGVVPKDQYEHRTMLALKDLHLLKLVKEGDYVISLRSFQGGIEYAHCRGIISPAYTVLKPSDLTRRGYFQFFFKSFPFIDSLHLYVTGIREGQNIDYRRLSRASLPVPPIEDQIAIGQFLRAKVSKINRYLRAQRRLIALLEEQKQALIEQAVTHGLDPELPLKPSGIEWIGKIPAHWEVMALRYKYTVELGKMLDTKQITGEHLVPYLRNADVQWDCINIENLPEMDIKPAEYERYTLETGDLLVCEGGEVGRCAFWAGDLPLCGYQKALHRLRPYDPSRDIPRFLYYLVYTVANRGVFLADGSENTIAHLTGEKLRRHRFAFPPPEEQLSIVAHLDKLVHSVDYAAERAQHQIDLIREYRTRLIADVVTGKLDVRSVPLPEPDADDAPDDFDDLEGETPFDPQQDWPDPEEESDD